MKTSARARSQSRPGVRNAIAALDRTAMRRVAGNDSRLLDLAMPRLSRLADHGLLWTGLAIGLWVTGDKRARRAAWRGSGGLTAASAAANMAAKGLPGRDRPGAHVPARRHLPGAPRTRPSPSDRPASAALLGAE